MSELSEVTNRYSISAMRDLAAALVAVLLLFIALSLATALHVYRSGRRRAEQAERQEGRTVIAEVPTGDGLVFFSEDPGAFHHGSHIIEKRRIQAVRVLINGAPIAAYESVRAGRRSAGPPTSFEDRPDGIARDRWDVAIEQDEGTLLVECGAIRERISQELARKVFDAVRRAVEALDRDL